jgi:ethanolamine transporter EutH
LRYGLLGQIALVDGIETLTNCVRNKRMNVLEIIGYVSMVVTGASALALIISKFTKNTVDDDIASWILKLKKILDKLALNS